jgi:hypothetical protein
MAAKKKTTTKPSKPKKVARKKTTSAAAKKRSKTVSKKVTKKISAPKAAEKKRVEKKKAEVKKRRRTISKPGADPAFSPEPRSSRSGDQSGDVQGLSQVEGADSESVDELVEEGNAFEADVVAGVESADDADEQEVHTHEVPEDDVPGEYLDKD